MKTEIITGDVSDYSDNSLFFPENIKSLNDENFDNRTFDNTTSELLEERSEINEIQNENNKNDINSTVFQIIDEDYKGFINNNDWAIAINTIMEYQLNNSGNSVENITLIEYDNKNNYQDSVIDNDYIKDYDKDYISDIYLNEDYEISRDIEYICNDFKNKIILKLNLQYQKEKLEYYEKMKDSGSKKDVYITFDDEVYKNIFQKTVESMNMLDYEVADMMNIEAGNFSRYKNLTKKNGDYHKQAEKHLSYKNNVVTMAKDLGLSLKDFCYFIWSRGHEFPTNTDDYDLIDKLLEKEMGIENTLYSESDKDL